MKYLVIYWVWIDCIILIIIENFDPCLHKTFGQVFLYSNEHKCVGIIIIIEK
jgi:hypothetical protein